MGVVYRAVDRELDREVAIKVPHSGRSAAFEARLRTESRILARLEHPGIVPIHDVGRLPDGRPFYVMKRVRGTTLSEHVGGLKSLFLSGEGLVCELQGQGRVWLQTRNPGALASFLHPFRRVEARSG